MSWSPTPRYRWQYRLAISLSCGHIATVSGRVDDYVPKADSVFPCDACDRWEHAVRWGLLR